MTAIPETAVLFVGAGERIMALGGARHRWPCLGGCRLQHCPPLLRRWRLLAMLVLVPLLCVTGVVAVFNGVWVEGTYF